MPIENIEALLNEYGHLFPYVYFGIISFIAMIMTVSDKRAAKKPGKERTPEARLWTVALIGGSVMMYTTMRMIHHKTKHMTFMVGLPIMIILQFAFAFALLILL